MKTGVGLEVKSSPKYRRVIRQIQELAQDSKLKPGDPLPPERELAQMFDVSYATLRQANDRLVASGFLRREHGRGTFLDDGEATAPSGGSKALRVGMLLVDSDPTAHETFPSLLLAHTQTEAAKHGYEFTFECLDSVRLFGGDEPLMLKNGSVDAVLLEGCVTDLHVRYAQRYGVPVVVVGNHQLQTDVPAVQMDVAELAYQMIANLVRHGRVPIWFQVDSLSNYYVHALLLQGYRRAMAELGPSSGACYVIEGNPRTLGKEAQRICDAGLDGAAVFLSDLQADVLPDLIEERGGSAGNVWFVCPPFSNDPKKQHGRWHTNRIIPWEPWLDLTVEFATAVVDLLAAKLKSPAADMVLPSVVLKPTCSLEVLEGASRWKLGIKRCVIGRSVRAAIATLGTNGDMFTEQRYQGLQACAHAG